MVKDIQEIVLGLKQKVNIDIDVFSVSGELIASTRPDSVCVFKQVPLNHYVNNIYQDKENNLTYFYIENSGTNYFFVIDGSNDISLNYAYMLSQLLKDYMLKLSGGMDFAGYVKQILIYGVTKEQAEIYAQKFKMPAEYCFAVAIKHEKKESTELINFLNQYSNGTDDIVIDFEDDIIAYIKFYNNDKEYKSATEFCEILWESIYEELNFKVKMGIGQEIKNLFELNKSYKQAVNAIRMGGKISDKDYIYSYKKYVFMKIVEDAPINELKQYMDVVIDERTREILDDEEMILTAEEFFSNSLNISETSRKLYMHRNTLAYRLDKIQKIMGLDIRRFADAVTFKITLMLYRLLQN